jgi:hypothetical protein
LFQINAHFSPIIHFQSRTSPLQSSDPHGSISTDFQCRKGLPVELRQMPMWPGIHNCRTGSVIQPSIRITEWAVENGILPQHRKAAGLIVVALWAGRRARARARARLIFVSIRGSTSPLRSLRVFASSRETNSQPPLPAAAVRRQAVAEGRSHAGKPELPAFAFIRVHSWFNVTPAFPSRLRVRPTANASAPPPR